MKARATSFATLKDLRQYIICLTNGGSPNHCYKYGDNGTGSWGDNTAQLTDPIVALPPSEMSKEFGSVNAAHGKPVIVLLHGAGHGKPFIARCGDKAPEEPIIDLNPASLKKAGLPTDTELSCEAEWWWEGDSDAPQVLSVD